MAKRTFAEDQLDGFVLAIRYMASQIRSLDDLGGDNALTQIAGMAGEAFLNFAQEEAPYWTGTLYDAHMMGEVEQRKISSGFEAEVSIFIDPNPALEHPIILGTFPGQYGPEYHRTKSQWFQTAREQMDPMFSKLINTQVKIYFEGFW